MTIKEMNDQLIEQICDRQNPNNAHGDEYDAGQYFGFEDGFKAGFELALVAIQNEYQEAGRCMIQKIFDQISRNKDKYLKM